jgi:phosphatidylserine decarboxylase
VSGSSPWQDRLHACFWSSLAQIRAYGNAEHIVYSTSPRHDGWVRPGAMYSVVVGVSARATVPTFLRRAAYQLFANIVGADLSEAAEDLATYQTFGDMFARRVQAGRRTIDGGKNAVISPCDGRVAAAGDIVEGALVQAKGRDYTVAELVADDDLATRLHNGRFLTVYLAPRDYHRVHSPVDGTLSGYDYLPGTLWPVSERFVRNVDRLLARNERAVLTIQTSRGPVVVVMVGAAGVGNLWLSADNRETRTWRRIFGGGERRRVELPPVALSRGDELGAFFLGSTVIVLLPPAATLSTELKLGSRLRMGQAIAELEAS